MMHLALKRAGIPVLVARNKMSLDQRLAELKLNP